jgi:ketosteroid isomerase-like protein
MTSPPPVDEASEAGEALRRIVAERLTAVTTKDAVTLAARQAPDMIAFDVLPPLQAHGSAEGESRTRAWFDSYAGDIGYQVRDLVVVGDRDAGFCSFLYHVSGTLVSGDEVSMWVRATLGVQRVQRRWLIVHDHESVPFDATTGQALLGLQP